MLKKDGSKLITVWNQQNGFIHCLAIDSRSMRFFYAVSKIRKITKKNSKTHWLTGKKMIEYESYKVHFISIYSIDYEPDVDDLPYEELRFKVSNEETFAKKIVVYYESLFIILQDQNEYGLKVYKLIRFNLQDNLQITSKPQILISGTRKVITSMQIVWKNADDSNTNKYINNNTNSRGCKNQCAQICVHVTDSITKCICKGGTLSCTESWVKVKLFL